MSGERQGTVAAVVVSVGAAMMNGVQLKRLVERTIDDGAEKIWVVFLDSGASLNLRVIHGLAEIEADGLVDGMVRNLRWALGFGLPRCVILERWSHLREREEVRPYVDACWRAWESESFREGCLNQTFRNLHPILRSHGIKRRGDERLRRLAAYMVEEVALKAFLASRRSVSREYGHESEMRFVAELYAGKYRLDGVDIGTKPETIKVSPGMEPLLHLDGIRYSYGRSRLSLDNVGMSLDHGEILGIVGPNGSGKTTLLNLVGGHLQCGAGSITLETRDITRLSPRERPVVTVFQDRALFPHMNVLENVMFGLRSGQGIDTHRARERSRHWLAAWKLESKESTRPGKLSGGEKQRVALTRALVMEPLVLLLDEPTAALDRGQRIVLQDFLRRFSGSRRTSGVLLVTHSLRFAASICDRLVRMEGGKPQWTGTPAQLFQSPEGMAAARSMGCFNVLEAVAEKTGTVVSGTGLFVRTDEHGFSPGTRVFLGIRWTDLEVTKHEPKHDGISMDGRVVHRYTDGIAEFCVVRLGKDISVHAAGMYGRFRSGGIEEGDRVWLRVPPSEILVLPDS